MSRKSNGRFAPGNPGGPGRPPRQAEDRYLKTLSKVATGDAWARICERAVKDAEAGDARARRWLSEYLLGKPSQHISTSLEAEGKVVTVEGQRQAILNAIAHEQERRRRRLEQTPESGGV